MRKVLLGLSALAASALLVPGEAAAQRFHPGGVRVGGMGGARIGAVGVRPGFGGVYRPGAVYRPYYGRVGRYPYYGGYYRRGWGYPYYGGAVAAGVLGGLTLGALSAPYYAYPDYGYPYGSYYGGGTVTVYASPVEGQPCFQGPPWCTAAGYLNMGYIRRQQGAPF